MSGGEQIEAVPLHRTIGRRLPGKDWRVGLYHSRGTGGMVRIREREADNNWEDVYPDDLGHVDVIREATR